MTEAIQKELDIAEEYILAKLIGNIKAPIISPKIKFYLKMRGISIESIINENIAMFEAYARDFMNDSGYFDGAKISSMLVAYAPFLEGVYVPNFKPIEAVLLFDRFIKLEKIGKVIQTL